MTIQIDITQNDLKQKLRMCINLARLISSVNILMIFNYSKYVEKFLYIMEQIVSNGNYEEIYQDLQQIERELLELI